MEVRRLLYLLVEAQFLGFNLCPRNDQLVGHPHEVETIGLEGHLGTLKSPRDEVGVPRFQQSLLHVEGSDLCYFGEEVDLDHFGHDDVGVVEDELHGEEAVESHVDVWLGVM